MRKFYFLSCVVFLVEGVFGADGVKAISANVGDDVTLETDDAEVQRADELSWRIQGEKSFIARLDREANIVSINPDDKRFSERLQLNKTTGSLTIKNINTADSGVYELQIRRQSGVKPKIFNLTVHHGLKSVSVMEGDTITLHTGVAQILTARLNGTSASQSNINLNKETGEITIRNIRGDQCGDFEVEINTTNVTVHRKFSINISGVFSNEKDGVKTVSEKTGTDVLLHTRLIEIEKDDPIEWTFGPQNISIAKTDGKRKIISYNYNDVRFKNRLHLQIETGDLTIYNANSEHSGLYQIKIINNTFTIQKRFSVTVSDSGSSAAVSGICGVSFGLLVWAVTVLLLLEVQVTKHVSEKGLG